MFSLRLSSGGGGTCLCQQGAKEPERSPTQPHTSPHRRVCLAGWLCSSIWCFFAHFEDGHSLDRLGSANPSSTPNLTMATFLELDFCFHERPRSWKLVVEAPGRQWPQDLLRAPLPKGQKTGAGWAVQRTLTHVPCGTKATLSG